MKKSIATYLFMFSGCVVLAAFSAVDQPKSNGAASAPAKAQVARATKIAIVEPQAVIAASEEWADKSVEVQQEFEKRALDLRARREELNKLAKSATGSAAERDAMKDMVKKQKDIEIDESLLEREFRERQQEMQVAIAQKVDAATEAVELAQGWDFSVPKFFGSRKRDCDITQAVIEELNKEYRKEKAAKKFKKDAAAAPRAAVPAITEKK